MLFYEQKDWEEDFRNPPAVFRLHMMCHDLADPEAEAPCSRVLSRAKDGVTGYVTNISWKSAGEYLKNPEAWKRLNDAVSACVKAGARVWLYDENGFPSGTAGGLTLRECPEAESLGIVPVRVPGPREKFEKPEDVEKVLCIFEEGENICAVCTVRLFEGTAAEANYGRKYINIADRRATDVFLRNTYDKYAENVKDFSQRIDAIFTDEPALMEMYIDWKPYPEGHKYAAVSWAEGLEERFFGRYGYDLLPRIRDLYEGEDERARLTRIHYRQTLAKAVAEAWFCKIGSWCREHGVCSAGHTENEEFIYEQVACYGNLFETLEYQDILGSDVLRGSYERYMSYYFIGQKFIGSLARIRGKSRFIMNEFCPLEEQFGAENDLTDENIRAVFNMLWMSGVNYINSYLDEKKFENPSGISDYIGRMGAALYCAVHDAKIGVYFPVETIQAKYLPLKTPAYLKYRSRDESDIGLIEDELRNLCLSVWKNGLDFDFLDAKAIESAKVENGVLHIGEMAFGVLIFSGTEVLPLSVLKKIRLFEESGGKVIWSGRKPVHGVMQEEGEEIRRYAEKIRLSADPVRDAAEIIKYGDRWESDRELFISPFLKNGKRLYMLINNHARPANVKLLKKENMKLADPSTGEIQEIGKSFSIAPYHAVFVCFSE